MLHVGQLNSNKLIDIFGGIGQVGRIKEKRGYEDQWCWNINIYTYDVGKNNGDTVLSYGDPSATKYAGVFYNDYMIRVHKVDVIIA